MGDGDGAAGGGTERKEAQKGSLVVEGKEKPDHSNTKIKNKNLSFLPHISTKPNIYFSKRAI